MKNKAAQQLGRLGGKVSSENKAVAVRENGARGGRPRTPKMFSRDELWEMGKIWRWLVILGDPNKGEQTTLLSRHQSRNGAIDSVRRHGGHSYAVTNRADEGFMMAEFCHLF